MEMTKERIADIAKEVAAEVMQAQKEMRDRPDPAADYEKMILAITAAHSPAPVQTDLPKGIGAARFLRAVAYGGPSREKAAGFAKTMYGEDSPVTKALLSTDAAAVVPTEYSSEIIELLKERAVFRSMNPRVVPMATGSISLPKLTGGATASYIGEGENITATEQTFGQINLSWKKLVAMVPVSNDMLTLEAAGAEAMIRDDTVGALATREDQAFLRSDGSENTPKGIKHYVPSANSFAANGTVNLANVTSDVAAAILLLREGHSRMLNVGWLWAPRTTMYLKQLRDGNGNFAYKEEMDGGMFWGFPYGDSTEFPTNLGGGTESEIQLVDFADVILGESSALEVEASREAAYWDGSALQSAFARDLTLLRVIARHDLGVRHEESLVEITAVKWIP
jgi:HK97 family phage major capsid protein